LRAGEFNSDAAMARYYSERAPVYDRVYAYPKRQTDLRFLEPYIAEQFDNREVLEIAAGTGYWSQFIIERANSLLATDANQETLDEISSKQLTAPIATKVADAYRLEGVEGPFTGVFAGLWFSHVPKQRRYEFLHAIHQRIEKGAVVVLLDNSSVQCERHPVTATDNHGNTFQDRQLDDGSVHQVLKNFPEQTELDQLTATLGVEAKYLAMDNFWLYQYVAVQGQ